MTRKVISMLMFLLVLGMSTCFAEWRTMTVTAYCDQGYTASGEYVSEGMVASDDLPIGTTVIINGESYIELSEEEKEALDNAVQMRNEIGDGMK